MARYVCRLTSNCSTELYAVSWSVPTSLAVPADTASGRSVVSRITSTGLPTGRLLLHAPLSIKTIVAQRGSRANALAERGVTAGAVVEHEHSLVWYRVPAQAGRSSRER